ncbi:MAG: transcription-repair coupling factor [Acholeplasmataceae bacterium]
MDIKDLIQIAGITTNKTLVNSTDSFNCLLIAKQFTEQRKTVFVVLPNLYDAQRYYDRLSEILNEDEVLFYPVDQMLTVMMALSSPEFKSERIFTLRQLLTDKPFVVIMTQEGLSYLQLQPKDYLRSVKKIEVKQKYELAKLVQWLIYNGYQRNYTIEKPGEFSVRGNIIDLYPPQAAQPYRLDFFDDELETIRMFDVETQRSFEVVDNVTIEPLQELFYTDKMKEDALLKIRKFFDDKILSQREREKLDNDIEAIDLRKRLDGLHLYKSFFNEQRTTILDFAKNKVLYYVEPHKMEINEKTQLSDLNTYAQTLNGQELFAIPFRISLEEWMKQKHIAIDNYGIKQANNTMDLGIREATKFQGNIKLFLHEIKDMPNYRIIININRKEVKEDLIKTLIKNKFEYHEKITDNPGIYIISTKSYGAFLSKNDLIYLLDEEQLYAYKHKRAVHYRSVLNQATKIRKVEDLTVGDFVVHYDYGIGQYIGLKTMELGKEKRDYLHIVYAQNEALYVPLDQINMVLKYSTHEGTRPTLSKMGGSKWNRTKAQVRMKIKDLSDRLINLYAQREQSEGFKFFEYEDLQKEFELDFQYQTTKDQEKAILETQQDMLTNKPMDRLVIGDVGFGKTEVALRAAFRAVLNTKQVLYLVPTTVLARQHYYTFKERFEKYGGNIALLSRFITRKKQTEVLDKLKKGLIDVVIGTHRLLSKDVVFKDLGLLIIDEEQRFGVEHKERIREIKHQVDTLTLSATPIPRTLQMGMMGLKDLSMIETPPMNRYPVQTYVVERHEPLIKEAITRELARGGQVFYLFNEVQGMERMLLKLKKLVPEARIAFAHGKMQRDILENVLSDFIDHQFDVLISTTIIETGIDIPNTNTIIIHDADRLGLSQLYQIRGRVGRSDRIAYAYLMYDGRKIMNDEARKRLSAIQDFTDLGSGYKVAMRDLAIRGAGDILGAEQSGFIDSVGIELYTKLLEEAMTGVNAFDHPQDTQIDTVFAARHVDPKYVNNDQVRIEIHKQISSLNTLADLEDLKVALKDRFGPLDVDLVLYMYEKLYNKYVARLGIQKTDVSLESVTLTLKKEASLEIDGKKLFECANKVQPPIQLDYVRGRVQIKLYTRYKKEHWLYIMVHFLENYFKK